MDGRKLEPRLDVDPSPTNALANDGAEEVDVVVDDGGFE